MMSQALRRSQCQTSVFDYFSLSALMARDYLLTCIVLLAHDIVITPFQCDYTTSCPAHKEISRELASKR